MFYISYTYLYKVFITFQCQSFYQLKSMYQQLESMDHIKIINNISEDSVTIIFRYEFQPIVEEGYLF